MTPAAGPRYCWWCNSALSYSGRPDGTPHGARVEIEPGQVVLVHRTCEQATKEARKSYLDIPPRYTAPEYPE